MGALSKPMADIVDKRTRSRMMAGIRGKNTKPELLLRSALHKRGFRYRIHVRDLPGNPDMVFAKYNAIIFVHGCFWHRHEGCRYATTPSSNEDFWKVKFEATIKRDLLIIKQLEEAGWRIAVIWECSLKARKISNISDTIASWLKTHKRKLELPSIPHSKD